MTKTPTQEEKDRAHCACLYVNYQPDVAAGLTSEAWRCQRCGSRFTRESRALHATAELARAEERIRAIVLVTDSFVKHARDSGWHNTADELERLVREAAEDDKLARGESEETKMVQDNKGFSQRCAVCHCAYGFSGSCGCLAKANHPKFTPKPGDWCTLLDSPDPADGQLIGRGGWFRGSGTHPAFQAFGDKLRVVHRDAVFGLRCKCHWEVGDSPCPVHGENEEAQAGQPPAVASGVAAGEVTDERCDYIQDRVAGRCSRPSGHTGKHATGTRELDEDHPYTRGFQAGRAYGKEERDAEVAELKRRMAEFDSEAIGWDARLAELELQGRVVKRMLTGRMQHTQSDKQTWESIEREERERAGK